MFPFSHSRVLHVHVRVQHCPTVNCVCVFEGSLADFVSTLCSFSMCQYVFDYSHVFCFDH